MEINISNSIKLLVTSVPNHDSIHIHLEDCGDGKGRLTISESSQSFTYFWNSMGGDLVEFVNRVNNQYLIGCLAPYLTSQIDDDSSANAKFAKNQVLKLRKEQEISASEARDLYHRIDMEDNVKNDYTLCTEIFGDDPYYAGWPSIPNPEYIYMESRLNIVRKAINYYSSIGVANSQKTIDECRIEFEESYAKSAGLYLEHIGYRYESLETEKAFKAWCHAKSYSPTSCC